MGRRTPKNQIMEAIKITQKNIDSFKSKVARFAEEMAIGWEVNYCDRTYGSLFKQKFVKERARILADGTPAIKLLLQEISPDEGCLPYAERCQEIFSLDILGERSFDKNHIFSISNQPMDFINMSSSKHFSSCFRLETEEFNTCIIGELLNPFSLIAKVDLEVPENNSMIARTLLYLFPRKEDLIVVVNPVYSSFDFKNQGLLAKFNLMIHQTFKKHKNIHIIYSDTRMLNARVINTFLVPPNVFVKPDSVDHFMLNQRNTFCRNLQFTR